MEKEKWDSNPRACGKAQKVSSFSRIEINIMNRLARHRDFYTAVTIWILLLVGFWRRCTRISPADSTDFHALVDDGRTYSSQVQAYKLAQTRGKND
jgi:hypothetical protein